MPRRLPARSKDTQSLLDRLNRDFTVAQDDCEHARRFNDPSRMGMLWKRCADCGLVLEERQRCSGLNPDGTRCMVAVLDESGACASHARVEVVA